MNNINTQSVAITVCTPTFNRGKYLRRIYESLLRQEFPRFEWLIIDDGSTDDTRTIVEEFLIDPSFSIKYIYQANSGKHIAVNQALDTAVGELFIILDSDDLPSEDMLQVVYSEWSMVEKKSSLSGMVFLTMFHDGKIVGDKFPFDKHCASLTKFYDQYEIFGDKCDIHVTKIFQTYKFPLTINERFCPEGLIWNRMASSFDTIFINKPIKYVEYLDDGLSANVLKIRVNSPINTMNFYGELMQKRISLKSRLRSAINFVRFSFHAGRYWDVLQKHTLLGIFLMPLAFVFYLIDRRQLNMR